MAKIGIMFVLCFAWFVMGCGFVVLDESPATTQTAPPSATTSPAPTSASSSLPPAVGGSSAGGAGDQGGGEILTAEWCDELKDPKGVYSYGFRGCCGTFQKDEPKDEFKLAMHHP